MKNNFFLFTNYNNNEITIINFNHNSCYTRIYKK